MNLVPTILCGGAGSRLWPVSRALHPKPFIKLDDGLSFLQKAFLRAIDQNQVVEVLTVTNKNLLLKVIDDYEPIDKMGIPKSFLLEPSSKNTAAAIAAACIAVGDKYGDHTLMLVLAADHLIEAEDKFREAVNEAALMAENNKIVTFGIHPESPETGYGYIQCQGNDVLQFVEKPSHEKAITLLEQGDYYWNSGMFLFQVKTMLSELECHCPILLDTVRKSLLAGESYSDSEKSVINLDAGIFAQVEENSIDYAVLERSKNIAMVACDIGWRDVGSWDSFAKLNQPDENGNQLQGSVESVNASNCYIKSPHRMTAVVGVDNLVVIDTPDAILIANRDKSQDVKKIYNQLLEQNADCAKSHRTVSRPWGTYTVLEEGVNHKIKRIEVKPHSRLSLQLHHHRSEHWVVITGEATVVNGDEMFVIHASESTFIAAGHKHRLSNFTDEPLIIIEVQTGSYVGEDDITRFEDIYGRC